MKPTTPIFDLLPHSAQPLPAFLALTTGASELAETAILTPEVMKWSPGTWLFDLRSCHEFWHRRAQSQGMMPVALIQHLLRLYCGSNEFHAAGADHPWQAVLMVGALQARAMAGLVMKASAFGQRLYRELNWPIWLAAADQLRIHLDAHPRSGRSDITCELAQLKRAVERMNLRTLRGFAGVRSASLQRRYGLMIAAMWRWTHAQAGTSLDGFAWVTWRPRQLPTTLRVLDYACWEWDQLAPVLVEDLDRLCDHPAWDRSDQVTGIRWELVFEDMQEVAVEIGFRHPHHLHSERGHHRTTVGRARERYFTVIKAWNAQRGEDIAAAAVISWRVAVVTWFRVPERQNELFPHHGSASHDRVQSLENRLHVPLQRYLATRDFLPEESYRQGERGDAGGMNESWQVAAQHRPLYLYRTPRMLGQAPRRQVQFLERIQDKWWRGEGGPRNRDYYCLREGHCRRWVYCDQQGHWYDHGLYS